ncbi:MAG TPA: DUF4136 domain-containing protein, partial [Sediminibacterium sp.]|nr:DUF4136 domain-containing protein [Sediminibacterium sp.]
MKTLIQKYALGMAVLLFAASCGPALKVSTDFDKNAVFSNYKTFSVYNLKTTGSVSQLNADRIVNAIKSELTTKGFQEAGNNADLIINAVTVLKDKQSVSASTNYYGYGGIYRPYSYWGGGMGVGSTTVSTYNYKDGSLIIDIVDNKTQKMRVRSTGGPVSPFSPRGPD